MKVHATIQGRVPFGILKILEETVEELTAARRVRHAVLGAEPGDGSYRWTGSAGAADAAGNPMTPETPYCLASVTKLYIGAAVLRLQEQGLLSIDDPLINYLPEKLVSGLHCRKGTDRTSEITLRHLLGHASGLPEYLSEAPKGKKALLDKVVKEGDQSWEISDILDMVRQIKGAHFNPRPFDGRRYTIQYSDTNFQLLMAVIEAVMSKPVHEAFAALLYKPLGLQRTWHPGTPAEAGMPAAAVPWAGDAPFDKPKAMRSFRDLYSTAGETLDFMRALITGKLFDNPETARLMRQHWNPLGFSLIPTSPGWPIEYGLAMMRFQNPGFIKIFSSMPALIGHTGATGSWLFYVEEFDLYLTGTVDQLTAPAVPFRIIPRLLKKLRSLKKTERQ